MNNSLSLSNTDADILFAILSKYDCKFYCFGSRVKGTNFKFSDIDLCTEGPIDLAKLKAELEESNLSVKVDVQKIEEMNIDFLDMIRKDLRLLDI